MLPHIPDAPSPDATPRTNEKETHSSLVSVGATKKEVYLWTIYQEDSSLDKALDGVIVSQAVMSSPRYGKIPRACCTGYGKKADIDGNV